MAKKGAAIDMLHGPLAKPLLIFAIPLAFTGILQQLFNTADILVLGKFVGTTALAAVGNNAPISGLLVTLFLGISLGSNVVIAQFIGGRRYRETTKAVHTSIALALVIGIVIMAAGELLAGQMLEALAVPPEVMPEAETYLRIYILALPAISLYNFEAAIFRARGDTKTPLYALLLASLLNIAGNLAAVLVLDTGIAGVAWATTISYYIGSVYLLQKLRHAFGVIRLELGAIQLNGAIVKKIIQIGLPAGIQGMVFCLSNLVIQAAINSLGATVMAASAAAFTIEINCYAFLISFGQALTTFVGQNYGAANLRRCRRVTRVAMALGLGFTVALSGLVCIFADPLLAFFDPHPDVIAIGRTRVYYIIGFYFLDMIIELISGAMRGYGYSLPPAILMLVTICGVRIGWIKTAFVMDPTFSVIMMSYPVSWAVTAVLLLGVYLYYRKNIRVNRVLPKKRLRTAEA